MPKGWSERSLRPNGPCVFTAKRLAKALPPRGSSTARFALLRGSRKASSWPSGAAAKSSWPERPPNSVCGSSVPSFGEAAPGLVAASSSSFVSSLCGICFFSFRAFTGRSVRGVDSAALDFALAFAFAFAFACVTAFAFAFVSACAFVSAVAFPCGLASASTIASANGSASASASSLPRCMLDRPLLAARFCRLPGGGCSNFSTAATVGNDEPGLRSYITLSLRQDSSGAMRCRVDLRIADASVGGAEEEPRCDTFGRTALPRPCAGVSFSSLSSMPFFSSSASSFLSSALSSSIFSSSFFASSTFASSALSSSIFASSFFSSSSSFLLSPLSSSIFSSSIVASSTFASSALSSFIFASSLSSSSFSSSWIPSSSAGSKLPGTSSSPTSAIGDPSRSCNGVVSTVPPACAIRRRGVRLVCDGVAEVSGRATLTRASRIAATAAPVGLSP
mmetsp:Transcript_105551/g.235613  ORF Transcript_105551/g.235613 Transcript_105551/m.235613 type:complete len:449 (+) Transcript_105551:782-2128(+)